MTDRREGGFTLVELLVTVVISGIIVGVITEALIQGFRTTDATSTRVARSSAVQAFAHAVTEDVQRAETVAAASAAVSETDCVTADDGRFLRLAWSAGTDNRTAVYALDPTGDGGHDLVRWLCVGTALPVPRVLGHIADTAGSPPPVTVACKALSTDPSTAACPSTPGSPDTVVLSIRIDPAPLPPSELTLQRRMT